MQQKQLRANCYHKHKVTWLLLQEFWCIYVVAGIGSIYTDDICSWRSLMFLLKNKKKLKKQETKSHWLSQHKIFLCYECSILEKNCNIRYFYVTNVLFSEALLILWTFPRQKSINASCLWFWIAEGLRVQKLLFCAHLQKKVSIKGKPGTGISYVSQIITEDPCWNRNKMKDHSSQENFLVKKDKQTFFSSTNISIEQQKRITLHTSGTQHWMVLKQWH